ncbi:hypothetical protein P7C73_g1403, partial [Tremellales sp. Uapishka_1]
MPATTVSRPSDRAWWKSSTVYQVYPPSFADDGAHGHGTLKGLLARVPYLKSLGVDIIWLSPIYPSPQADMGYDISNYRDIDPRYGTLADYDDIVKAAKERGMKVVMDLVVNHTSEQHEWFKESKKSTTNPKRDYYIWRKPKLTASGERRPPNNWKSVFGGGSAWEYDETTGEYYLHLFLKEQPDLNWENDKVRQEVWDIMRYWLEKGSDGFRMDVINFISKVPGLPDAPIKAEGREFQHFGDLSTNGPKMHEWMKEMNREVLSHYDCFAVGEAPGDGPIEDYAPYSVPENKELQMIFHFHHFSFDMKFGGLGRDSNPNWKLSDMKKIFNHWQVGMEKAGGWNSNYLENHDQPRMITRVASDHPEDRVKSGKLVSMFHCSLTGTLFIYQGEEIGMSNVPRDWSEKEYKDIESIQNLQGERAHRRKVQGKEDVDVSDVLESMRLTARDNGRTPMQWDDTENAGFTKGVPWMRVHDDYREGWNAAAQVKDEDSVWSFWQKMLGLRKRYESLVYGEFIPLDEGNEETYAYIRDDPTISQKLLVVLNFARGNGRGNASTFIVPETVDISRTQLLISNGQEKEGSKIPSSREIALTPWEGRIYLL